MTAWTLDFDDREPGTEGLRETLCTLGNGYLATRGAAPEQGADGVHYPGTYAAGCYNRLSDVVDGVTIENESLVNLPNWLPLTFRAEDGPWFGQEGMAVIDDRQELDLRRGVLTRRLRTRDTSGRIIAATQRRFVHLRRAHVCGLQTTFTAQGWSGSLAVRSALDTTAQNYGVARYRELSSQHVTALSSGPIDDESVLCVAETNQSHLRIAEAARTRVTHGRRPVADVREPIEAPRQVGHQIEVEIAPGRPVTVEKLVAIYTSHDSAISEPAVGAIREIQRLPDFDELLSEHVLAWSHVWQRFGISLSGVHVDALRVIRLDLFHLLQTVSRNSVDLDVGLPARGLHGEAYRGHILWDELFAFPILNLHVPPVSRALLLYRYRRLPQARRAAREVGKAGAMYPWQSGSDGREESQRVHLNPMSGRWIPDRSDLQRHVGLAVAYNTWHYYQVTNDREFLANYGAEMILEIARFFADLATYDQSRERYVIRGVVGPDEFHTGYPDDPKSGIDNNAYTNVMTVWVLLRALDALDALDNQQRVELTETLALRPEEEERWRDITCRMLVPVHGDGIISQFEGYEELAEFNWQAYRERYGDIRRLDRILESEGDSANSYKASKQADVLMLFYLLSADEIAEIFDRLGYRLGADMIPKNVDYYLARTTHGSTLSAVVHAWVLARGHRAEALQYALNALVSDVSDVQGGTTAEGIHLAAMAGSVDVLQRCFAGLEARGDMLQLNPYWPPELGALEFVLRYRDHALTLRISGAAIRVAAAPGDRPAVNVCCRGELAVLRPGDSVTFANMKHRASRD